MTSVFEQAPFREGGRGVEVCLHAFLILAVNEREWSDSLPGKTYNISYVGGGVDPPPSTKAGIFGEAENLSLSPIPQWPISQPSHYTH
jgi:hypothetical protein